MKLSTMERLEDWLPPILSRLLRGDDKPDSPETIPIEPRSESNKNDTDDSDRPALDIDDVFFVVEMDGAEVFVGDLFRRRFNTTTFPECPRHFVAFASLPDESVISLGYVHYSMWEGCALCGGLVKDERHFNILPSYLREMITERGGVAELLFRKTLPLLQDCTTAVWAHVGNKRAEEVCNRVGFQFTESQHVLVAWNSSSLTPLEKEEWVERVTALGPF
jgi:hypothetical protein